MLNYSKIHLTKTSVRVEIKKIHFSNLGENVASAEISD